MNFEGFFKNNRKNVETLILQGSKSLSTAIDGFESLYYYPSKSSEAMKMLDNAVQSDMELSYYNVNLGD